MAPPTLEAIDDTTAVLVPDFLTVDGVPARRSKAGRLAPGPAAKLDEELYKGRGSHEHKPLAQRFDHRFTIEANARQPANLKGAAKYLSQPGIISLGGGLPSSEHFPFEEMTLKVPARGKFTEQEVRDSGVRITAGKHDIAEGKSDFDISVAFNYSVGIGAPQMLRFAYEHTELVHNPPYRDWQCAMTVGATSALDTALRIFGRAGTYMLSEEYTFATALQTAAPLGIKCGPVAMDVEGMLPDALDRVLAHWDPAAHFGAPKPFLVYTVPSGQNPTGATQSLARRRALYAVAQTHDLYILEDEPYYYLQMQPYTGRGQPDAPPPATHAAFLASLVPSLLSLDTDGRVLRLDSFSKVVAPGMRLGWVTAPAPVIDRWAKHADVALQGPAGIAQLALYKLLDEHWGHAGYLDWLVHIRLAYSRRRDVMLAACEDFLPRDVASWTAPSAGMFHWLRIAWQRHPRAGTLTPTQIEERIFLKIIDAGALVMRGSWFRADFQCAGEPFDPEAAEREEKVFLRATYAAAPEEKIREAIRRVGVALRAEFGLEEVEGAGNGNGA